MRSVSTLVAILAAAAVNANPLPVITPAPTPTPTAVSARADAPCTTWVGGVVSLDSLIWQPKIITPTQYLSTVTEYEPLDCGGCAMSTNPPFYLGHGPAILAPTTITTDATYTTTVPVCKESPSNTAEDSTEDSAEEAEENDDDAAKKAAAVHRQVQATDVPSTLITRSSGGCTHTVLVGNHEFTHGPTKTVWASTVDHTNTVDCLGCAYCATAPLVPVGHGPVVHFTTTVLATAPTTREVYACATSST